MQSVLYTRLCSMKAGACFRLTCHPKQHHHWRVIPILTPTKLQCQFMENSRCTSNPRNSPTGLKVHGGSKYIVFQCRCMDSNSNSQLQDVGKMCVLLHFCSVSFNPCTSCSCSSGCSARKRSRSAENERLSLLQPGIIPNQQLTDGWPSGNFLKCG